MEWVTLALNGGGWIFVAVSMARGWLVSRSVAERIAGMERLRGDEWKAAAELLQQTVDTLRGQRDSLMAPVQALLPPAATTEGKRAA